MINAVTVTLIFSATVYFLWSPVNLIGREGESAHKKRQGAKWNRGRIGDVHENLPGF